MKKNKSDLDKYVDRISEAAESFSDEYDLEQTSLEDLVSEGELDFKLEG